jgi:hypothetical protein
MEAADIQVQPQQGGRTQERFKSVTFKGVLMSERRGRSFHRDSLGKVPTRQLLQQLLIMNVRQ